MRRMQTSKVLWITFFITPGLLVVGLFILLPLFMSLYNSLFSWKQLIRADFIGLENFRRLLGSFPYQERFF
ncbi:MAG: sugar ABC transporter permease, partial [Sphaerochaeta sp.]|nr:sugar ABC transporter permease [Sphaerochaeta sp.]